MFYKMRRCFFYFAMILLIAACDADQEKSYPELVKKELAKGIRNDSLFLGIYLGMSNKDFYGHCWELNKKGVISDGNNNSMVKYKLDSALKHPATMNFYPDFYDNKIFKMRVEYQYDAWAPWNKDHFADSLLTDVVKLYSKWYPEGNEFISLTDSARGTIYVKVDGNRRITIGKYSDMLVKADFTDLLIEEKLKK